MPFPTFDDVEKYTPKDFEHRYMAIETITLAQLLQMEAFSWDDERLSGCFDGLGDAIASRLQNAFVARYLYEEIAVLPPGQWIQRLGAKIRYQLVPKYKPLYDAIASGDFNPTIKGSEWHKERRIRSEFPETQISGNSDYLSDGEDSEYQTIRTDDQLALSELYYNSYKDIDTAFLDELEIMFATIWSVQVNAL